MKDITQKEIEAVKVLLEFIGENPEREGLLETPKRFLKAWRDYWASGYGKDAKSVMKVFSDGAENYKDMVVVKNIKIHSHCEHHLAPILGVAHIAYIPNGKILGLSKLERVAHIYARRLQVQERMTAQIADALDSELKPLGVAVFVEAEHLCMKTRGVCDENSTTTTAAMRGIFLLDEKARNEFYRAIER